MEYEVKGTADDAQKAMRDLVSSAMTDIKLEEVDMTQAVVEGFQPNIRLMPHQIQGRAWMREREKGIKTGGILADVSLLFSSVLLSRNPANTRVSSIRMYVGL